MQRCRCNTTRESDSVHRGTLRWRHNDHDSVSNHQPHGCLLNRLFRRRSKKTSKLRVTGLCVGNSPGPVNSPHKGPVTRKMFPFDDVIMNQLNHDNITTAKQSEIKPCLYWLQKWSKPADYGQIIKNIIKHRVQTFVSWRPLINISDLMMVLSWTLLIHYALVI